MDKLFSNWELPEIKVLLGETPGRVEKKYMDHFKNSLRINNTIIYHLSQEGYASYYKRQNMVIIKAIMNANKRLRQ